MRLRDHKKLHLFVLFTVLLTVAIYFQSGHTWLTKAAVVTSSPAPTTMPNITLSYDKATFTPTASGPTPTISGPTPIKSDSDSIGSAQSPASELSLDTKGGVTSDTGTVIDHDKELPETGLPLVAVVLVGLLPAGISLKKLARNYQNLVDRPNYLWQERDFSKASSLV